MLNRASTIPIVFYCLLFSVLSSACSSGAHQPSASAPAEQTRNAGSAMPSAPKQRFIIVLLDVSRSFPFFDRAQQQLAKVVAALGPNDTLLVITVGAHFDPALNTVIQTSLPGLPPHMLNNASSLREQNEQQADLNLLWSKIEKQKQDIITAARAIVTGDRATDLYSALAYCAYRLSRAGDVDKLMFLFTDLEQDARVIRSRKPPSAITDLTGVEVTVLCVPWQGSDAWNKLAREWQDWALERGARSFSINDLGESQQVPLLAPNTAPRTASRTPSANAPAPELSL